MSWIVRDLWRNLDEHRGEYESFLRAGKFEGFAAINRIATLVGNKWGITIQVNFPPGREMTTEKVGRRDLSLLAHKDWKKFEGITMEQLEDAFHRMGAVSYESVGFGHDGYKIKLSNGRIDCLPSGVHVWCEITPQVLDFLDWLFTTGYGLKPSMKQP